MRRLQEEKLGRRVFEWYPPGRRNRHRNSKKQEIRTGKRKRGVKDLAGLIGMEKNDKTSRTERCLYIL